MSPAGSAVGEKHTKGNDSRSLVPIVPVIPLLQLPGLLQPKAPARNPRSVSPVESSDELQAFVYNVGFLHAAWADTILQVGSLPVLHLHALFVSKSPVMYTHLTAIGHPPPYHITINVDDPNLTTPAVSTVLATLYGHSVELANCEFDTAKELLAAAHLFGLDAVARKAFDLLLSTLSINALEPFFDLALNTAGTYAPPGPNAPPAGLYPPYTQGLLSTLTDFVVKNVDLAKPVPPSLRQTLISLPFMPFKVIVENLKAPSPMELHSFAQTLIKERTARNAKLRDPHSQAPVLEENAVLSFGGGSNGLQIVQKQTNPRAWA